MLLEARLRGDPVEARPAPAPETAERAPDEARPAAPQEGGTGVSPADIAAMSRDEQDAFVTGMVDRLAARLEENAQDLEGWMRLARAYKVLGREDDARLALIKAREAFASDEQALGRIAGAEQALGLGAEEEKTTQ